VPLDPVPLPLRPVVAAGLAKDPQWRPADAAGLVIGLQNVAAGAYGQDWHDRGRSHLGEAALLLAALWPAGPPPATQGTAVQRISLLHRITPVKAAIAAGTVVAVAAGGTALAAALTHKPPAQHHPIAAPAVSVSLTASPTPTPSPSPSPTPSPTPSPSPSPSASSTFSTPPPPPPPPSVTRVPVPVSAGAGWVDTGITVNSGDVVTITASGSWTPAGESYYTGPDGFSSFEWQDNFLNTTDIGVCATCATTKAPSWGALISYTGGSPPEPGSYTNPDAAAQAPLISVVGSYLKTSWPLTGELWLGMNDDAYTDNTYDNAGEAIAIVTVRGAPAAGGGAG
jgi:hypothetical protein